jgi:hypothetical protein
VLSAGDTPPGWAPAPGFEENEIPKGVQAAAPGSDRANAGILRIRDTENKRLTVDADGEKITFSIAEKYSRTEHVIKHAQYAWMNERTYEYHFKGELKLTIDGSFAGQKGWSDGARARIEEKLGNFVVGLIGAARAIRKLREVREAKRLRGEEAAKIRQHKEEQLRKLSASPNPVPAGLPLPNSQLPTSTLLRKDFTFCVQGSRLASGMHPSVEPWFTNQALHNRNVEMPFSRQFPAMTD